MSTNNIVLIHGLWMTSLSWEFWTFHYTERGYNVFAPNWPGLDSDIRQLRRTPESFAEVGIGEIVDHYDKLIRSLDTPPIIMGHSFGGLVTQMLLDRGLGVCGVAIASAPIKGTWTMPYSTMRVVTPALINPRNYHRAVPLTPEQFHYAFMNTNSREESFRIYQRYAVPGPDHVLFQAGFANFNPNAATKVNVRNHERAPLLMIAGTHDHVSPPQLVQANARLYRHSRATTAYHEFPGRTHFILGQPGWREVANYSLDWARDQLLVRERMEGKRSAA